MKALDTIAAIATPNAPGGIGIVRISGSAAIVTAQKLFYRKKSVDWSRLQGYHMMYGTIKAAGEAPEQPVLGDTGNEKIPNDGNCELRAAHCEMIDEAICLVFRSPGSYTGEDVVELQCHGGLIVLRRVLRAVLACGTGVRLAEPGEFTKRAFLNGKLDLAKAEAVMQLVRARSEQASRAAAAAMGGSLSQRIAEIRGGLIALAAHSSAWIDYPEDVIEELPPERVALALHNAREALRALLSRCEANEAVMEGVDTVLLGKPNVGKSTLMNQLAGYSRSIVTELPGTTRDTVTEMVQLGNVLLRLTDTAGIHETEHPIERIGVERSRTAAARAALLLLLLDASAPLSEEDEALLAQCEGERTIVLCNKSDLGLALDLGALRAKHPYVLPVSAATGEGLESLARALERLLGTERFSPCEPMLATQRQRHCAEEALAALQEAVQALEQGFGLDAIQICVEDAVQALYSLTGERAGEAIVNEVFEHFCVGK
ncbi:MAG: tRNA uridine-5-carboxymethylaminomethyl(34) synthesis GTPase MnmE [Oscillospiraceae bacterium]|nr:tRNA uridine-5-carboxymethylaminomethyl(34) synthesis GTPase MnmE [Oscillospiraceae bacterium]